MACVYKYDGKTYDRDDFTKVLLGMKPSEASKYMSGVSSIPDAPFITKTKNYSMLAFKRAVRMAAEGRFDKIGWTPGSMQINRYEEELRKNVDEIRYESIPTDGKTPLWELDVIKDGKSVLSEDEVTLDRINELLGKDIAEKIEKDKGDKIADQPYRKWRSISGEGLAIGGQGMKSFYDKMLVNEVNKFFNKKKWGKAKVETTKIPLTEYWERGDPSYPIEDVDSSEIWTLKITPEIKQKALREGMPLFSVKKPDLDPDIQELLNKLMPEAKESLEKLKEPTQKKINKEANGLFKYAQKRFGKRFVDKDMKFYDRAFGVPYWLGKKFKSMAVAVRIEIDAAETRSTELFNDYEGALGDLQDGFRKWSKAKKKEFTDLIWKWDGRRMPKKAVPTDWHKPIEAGEDIEINPEHYEEVRKYLIDQGATSEVVDGFLTIRKKLDEKFVDIDNTMRIEQLDPALITEYRAEIKKVHNYFPHRRTGNAFVQIFNKENDNVVFREHYNTLKDRLLPTNKKATARAEKWLKDAIKKGDLKGELSDYRIHGPEALKELPDEVFFQLPVESIQQIVTQAGRRLETARAEYEAERLYNKEGRSKEEALKLAKKRLSADMEDALSKAVAETFKARGWGKHGIHRKNIPGHETEDVFGILFDYLSGYSGFKTKIERTKAHHKNLINLDAKKKPAEYRHLSKYVKDMLANQDRMDRTVDTLRGLFFVKYLGFVVKSGMVNLTQNAVMAAPMLGLHTKGAHRKLGRAMVDVRKALTAKNAWTGKEVKYGHLTKGEQQALHDMIESGASMDLFLRELKGNMPGVGMGRHFKKVIDKSGIFMQVAEKFNRASTGLAAYRVGVNEKGMTHDEAVELAKQVIYDSHFLYGKANMPSAMRGGDFQKFVRAGYTFRSFSHNYILAMKHLAFNQPGGKKAFFRSLRNLFLMGGLTSIPFFKGLSEALFWAIGEDDEDALTKLRGYMPNEWTKDLIVYGLPGVVGADLSGSLSIEVPRNWKEIAGVPYAAIEDSFNMYKSLKSGQTYRAISETPITPISIRNAMRGLELYKVGHRTRSGRDINTAGKVGPRKITGKEFAQKSLLGLQPTSVSKGFASYRATKKMQDSISSKRKAWADQFVNAFKRGDKEGWQAVLREVSKWNVKASKDKKPHRIINIRGMIESRMKPGFNNIPKSMRYKALEIQKQWE